MSLEKLTQNDMKRAENEDLDKAVYTWSHNTRANNVQSQKTQGFCVADFATLSDETRSRSKIFPLFIWIKEP